MKLILFVALVSTSCLFAEPITQACGLYSDQKQEEAFRAFLDALAKPIDVKETEVSDSAYDEALKVYLDPTKTPTEIAKEILEKHGDAKGPLIGYLLAVSHANQGDFEKFFHHFWNSYQAHPSHFLAFKAQAVLHIKLLERAPTPEAREKEKHHIVRFACQALDYEANDHSLYRFIIAFSSEGERPNLLKANLNKIINNNIITPRADIKFYVQQAVEFKEYDLAQRYLDKTREWYKFSRSINAAQDYLDREKAS